MKKADRRNNNPKEHLFTAPSSLLSVKKYAFSTQSSRRASNERQRTPLAELAKQDPNSSYIPLSRRPVFMQPKLNQKRKKSRPNSKEPPKSSRRQQHHRLERYQKAVQQPSLGSQPPPRPPSSCTRSFKSAVFEKLNKLTMLLCALDIRNQNAAQLQERLCAASA